MLNPAMSKRISQPLPILAPTGDGGSEPQSLFGRDRAALAALMAQMGEPAWRGRQIAEAIYNQRVIDLDAIATLPKSLRGRLAADGWQVGRPVIARVFQSVDGTERYLIQCQGVGKEGETVETVWMPEGDNGETDDENGDGSTEVIVKEELSPAVETGVSSGGRSSVQIVGRDAGEGQKRTQKNWDRATLCISSQVGCAVNCEFCLTARLGLLRNLTAGEIAGQVLAVFDRHGVDVSRDRVNLVFMGMGEPFLNYDNFMASVRLLINEVGLSPRRMTVSTSGIVPGIERFAEEPAEVRPRLAISLNAPNDTIRSRIMPINRKWPIAAVIEAVRQIKLRHHERITFEYVLLGGLTDQAAHAAELARLVRRSGLPAKVNLIAWNPGPGIDFTQPEADAVEAFRQTLIAAGIPAYLRKPRGRDIYAACGQLKRTVEG
jgi:23S rRNA (adenine2503-C2)-methyltransferase